MEWKHFYVENIGTFSFHDGLIHLNGEIVHDEFLLPILILIYEKMEE